MEVVEHFNFFHLILCFEQMENNDINSFHFEFDFFFGMNIGVSREVPFVPFRFMFLNNSNFCAKTSKMCKSY
jgi:hypothetical protein